MKLTKTIGPGLLFASTAIGTSHLVLSTRAGAHYGLIFIWIILGALLLKYPFYEFGTRYPIATGKSLVYGYKQQGGIALGLFTLIICINMFAVTGAVGAVSAGLLSTLIAAPLGIHTMVALILIVTVALLFFGGYAFLDGFIKILSVILFLSVTMAFVAVLIKGPTEQVSDFTAPVMFDSAGLALLISLIGWMPAGMEASTMNSIWVVEKWKDTNHRPTIKEGLLDFELGYGFTVLLAIMFLVIGSYTVYGSNQLLEGNANQFSTALIKVFTANLGSWAFPIIGIAAFGTIYGTLITILDAFARSLANCILELRPTVNNRQKANKLYHKSILPVIAIGGFLLFYLSASSMVKVLEFATVLSFITAPFIAYFNLRAICSAEVPKSYQPAVRLIYLAYLGLGMNVIFAVFYLYHYFTS